MFTSILTGTGLAVAILVVVFVVAKGALWVLKKILIGSGTLTGKVLWHAIECIVKHELPNWKRIEREYMRK